MAELCTIVGALLLILLLVTVVGHALWLLIAALLRSGKKQPGVPEARVGPLDEVAIARRRVHALYMAGLIDVDTADRITIAFDRQHAAMRPPVPDVLLVATPPVPHAESAIVGNAPASDEAIAPPPLPPTPRAVLSAEPRPIGPTGQPRTPRRPMNEVLSAFMAESNIRWGELVGGALIVGCAMALVITFWQAINQHALFKYGLFTSVTAAVFGVGLYTHHRWKLPMTSRGTLLVAMLLVPLNYLAIGALSEGGIAQTVATVGEIADILIFGLLALLAAGVLTRSPDGQGTSERFRPLPMAVGLVGISATQAAIHRLVGPDMAVTPLLAVAALPLAIYLASTGWALVYAGRADRVGAAESASLFRILGLNTAAMLLALGALAHSAGDWTLAVHRIAPALSIAGLPCLAVGMFLWRRLEARELASMRTAATSVGIVGALTLFAGMLLSWPSPAAMFAAGLFGFAALSAIAVVWRIPATHLLALPCLAVAYILAYHLSFGHMEWSTEDEPHLVRTLISADTGAGLVGLVTVVGTTAASLAHLKRDRHAFFYGIGGVIFAIVSMVLAGYYGIGRAEDHGATWVFTFYAATALAVAAAIGSAPVTWAAAVLAAIAIVQGIVFRYPDFCCADQRWTIALLIHASIMAVIALAARFASGRLRDAYCRPTSSAGITTAIVAAIVMAGSKVSSGHWEPSYAGMAAFAAWIAGVFLATGIADTWPIIFAAFQLALTAAIALASVAFLESREWFRQLQQPLLDIRALQFQFIALATLSCTWMAVRGILRRFGISPQADNSASRLIYAISPSLDRGVAYVLLFALAYLGIHAVLPGIASELTPAAIATVEPPPGHALAAGAASWVLLALLLAVYIADHWQNGEPAALPFAAVTLACACPLFAAQWQAESAAASAYRWAAAILLAAASIPIWWAHGRRIARRLHVAKGLLLTFTAGPILILTIWPAMQTITGYTPRGPIASSPFGQMGSAINYVTPLAGLIAVLVGYAVRERSSEFAFAGGLALNLTVTLGYILRLVTVGHALDAAQWIHITQLNAAAMALYSIGWLAIMRWSIPAVPQPQTRTPALLIFYLSLGFAALLAILGSTEFALIFQRHIDPARATAVCQTGWIAWPVIGVAFVWMLWMNGRRIPLGFLFTAILITGSLAALTAASASPARSLSGSHTLLVARLASGWLMLGIGLIARFGGDDADPASGGAVTKALGWSDCRQSITLWTALFGSLAIPLSAIAMPGEDWGWSACGMFAASLLSVGLTVWTLRGRWLYPAGILVNLAASIWFANSALATRMAPFEMVYLNAIIFAGFGLIALWIELVIVRPQRHDVVRLKGLAFHHVTAILSVAAPLVPTSLLLLAHLFGSTQQVALSLHCAAAAASLILLFACLWDIEAKYAIAGIYLAVISLGAAILVYTNWNKETLIFAALMFLTALSVLAGHVQSVRLWLAQLAERSGVPVRESWLTGRSRWFIPVLLLQSAAVVILAGWLVLFLESPVEIIPPLLARLAAATAIIAQAVGIGLVAHDQDNSRLRQATLAVGALGAILWGWAWLHPAARNLALDRMVIAMLALAAISAFFAIGLVKCLNRQNAWTDAARRLTPIAAASAMVMMLAVLSTEATMYDARLAAETGAGVPMAIWAMIAVAAALAALAATSVACAIIPGRDPFDLSERGRTAYIYAAELLLVLLFVHAKLCKPDLFNVAIWTRFWPLIVLPLAFLGAGLSELFRRQNRLVLAEPLENSAAFFPLFPITTYWLLGSVWTHQQYVNYGIVLLISGLLYGMLAHLRRSFWFGLMAALAGNGALWYLLHHARGLSLTEHPQLWLIPPALSILAAAYLNRDRLSADAMKTIRYVSLMTVYISSTAEIWLNTNSPWLPLVLAMLSVLGVMAGILLRVQSFLFLGGVFLLVSIAAMIRYAAQQVHASWPWLVAGLALGMVIVVVFALFEQKRAQMLKLVDGLKEWEP